MHLQLCYFAYDPTRIIFQIRETFKRMTIEIDIALVLLHYRDWSKEDSRLPFNQSDHLIFPALIIRSALIVHRWFIPFLWLVVVYCCQSLVCPWSLKATIRLAGVGAFNILWRRYGSSMKKNLAIVTIKTCVPLNLSTLIPQNRIKRLGIKKTDQHIANTVHLLYVFFLNSFSLRFWTLRETWMRDARNLFTIRIKVITITRRAATFNDIDRLAKRKISNCYCFSFC